MFRKINIPEREIQPGITLDAEKGIFRIVGRACPEDAFTFYAPVIEWLEDYVENPNDETIFEFYLTYYNTASSKVILRIMQILEKIQEKDKKVEIHWYHHPDDEDMMIAGEDYSEIVDITFKVKESTDDFLHV